LCASAVVVWRDRPAGRLRHDGLTPAQAADLLAGRWYVNIHTARYPGGEIRAQVTPRQGGSSGY